MKIVKSSVSILPQEPGVDGLMKHVEKLGRIAYLSEIGRASCRERVS